MTVLIKKQEQREIFCINLFHKMLSSMESDYMEFLFRFLVASSEIGKCAVRYLKKTTILTVSEENFPLFLSILLHLSSSLTTTFWLKSEVTSISLRMGKDLFSSCVRQTGASLMWFSVPANQQKGGKGCRM